MYSKLIFFIFSSIYLVNASDDSDEGRYIDLLPEDEKRAFLERVARRILDEVEVTGEKHKSGEIADAQLDEHSEYVAKLLKEEKENMQQRQNITKRDDLKTDESIPVAKSIKEQKLNVKNDENVEDGSNKPTESKKEIEVHNVGTNDKLDNDNIDFTLREGELKIVQNKEIISTTAKVNIEDGKIEKSILKDESSSKDNIAMEEKVDNNTKLHAGHKHLDIIKNETKKDPISIEITIYDKSEEDIEPLKDNKFTGNNSTIDKNIKESEIPVAIIMDPDKGSSKTVANTDVDFLLNNSNETSKYLKNERIDAFDDTRKFTDTKTNNGVEPQAAQTNMTNSEAKNPLTSENIGERKIFRRYGIDETTEKKEETQTEKAETVVLSDKILKTPKKEKTKKRHVRKVKAKSSGEKILKEHDLTTTEKTEKIYQENEEIKEEKQIIEKESTKKILEGRRDDHDIIIEKFDDVKNVKRHSSTDKVNNLEGETTEMTTINTNETKTGSYINASIENKDEFKAIKEIDITPPIKGDDHDITIKKHKISKSKKKHKKKPRKRENTTETTKLDVIDVLTNKNIDDTIQGNKVDKETAKILKTDDLNSENGKTYIPEKALEVKHDDHDIKTEKSNAVKTKTKHVKSEKVELLKSDDSITENTEKDNTENEKKMTVDKGTIKVLRNDVNNFTADAHSDKLMEVTKIGTNDTTDVKNDINETITKSKYVKILTTAHSVFEKSEEITQFVTEDPANSTQVDKPKDETKTILKENTKSEAKENIKIINKLGNTKETSTLSTIHVNPVNAPGTLTTHSSILKDATVNTGPKPIKSSKEVHEPVKFITKINKAPPKILRQNYIYIPTTAKAPIKKTIFKQKTIEQSNTTMKKGYIIQNEAETQIENSQKLYDLKTKYEKENNIKEEYIVYEIPAGKTPFVNGKLSIPPEMLNNPLNKEKFQPEKFKVLSGKPIARTGNIDDMQLDNEQNNFKPLYYSARENTFLERFDLPGMSEKSVEKESQRSKKDKTTANEEANYVPVYSYSPDNAYFNPNDRFGEQPEGLEKPVDRKGDRNEDGISNTAEKHLVPVYSYSPSNAYFDPNDKFVDLKDVAEMDSLEKSGERQGFDEDYYYRSDEGISRDSNDYPPGNIPYGIDDKSYYRPKFKKQAYYELDDSIGYKKGYNNIEDDNPYYHIPKLNFTFKKFNAEEDDLNDPLNDRVGPVTLKRDYNSYHNLPKDKLDDDNPYYHIPKINFKSAKVNDELEYNLFDFINNKEKFAKLNRDDNPYYYLPKDKMDDDNPYYHIPKVNFKSNLEKDVLYHLNRDDNPYYHLPKEYQSRNSYQKDDNTYYFPKHNYERTKTNYDPENNISKEDEIKDIIAEIRNNNRDQSSNTVNFNKAYVKKTNQLKNDPDSQVERVLSKDQRNKLEKSSKKNQNDYPYSGFQDGLKNRLSALRNQIIYDQLQLVPQIKEDEFILKINDGIKPLNPKNIIIQKERKLKNVVNKLTEYDNYDSFESHSKEESLRKQYTEESDEPLRDDHDIKHQINDLQAVANMSDSRDVVPAVLKLQSVFWQNEKRFRKDAGYQSPILLTNGSTKINMDSLPTGPKNSQAPLRTRDHLLDSYLSVMEDLIRNDAPALHQYDWLATAVEIQAALKKCIDLTKRLQLGETIDPADLELLYYNVYLYQISKDDLAKYRSDRGLYVTTDIQKGTGKGRGSVETSDKKLTLNDFDQNMEGALNDLDYSIHDVKGKFDEDPMKMISYLKHLSIELKNLKAAFERLRTPKKRRDKRKDLSNHFEIFNKRNDINGLMQYLNENEKGRKFKFYSVKSDSKNKDFSDLLQLSKGNKKFTDSSSITYEQLLDLLHDDSKARDIDNLAKLGLANSLKDTLWPNNRPTFKAKNIFKSLLKKDNTKYRRFMDDVSPLVKMFLQPTKNYFEDKLKEYEKLLYEIQDGLDNFHDAIKHVAMVSKGNRNLFPNIRELYLSGSSRRQAAEVLLHLSTARLMGLVNASVRNGLSEDYQRYIEGHQKQVERTREETVFVLRLLEELRINE